VDGQLLYVFEFPFRFKSFVKRLRIQLKKRFPKGDKSGQYLRGARFNYKDYMNCPELKVIFINRNFIKNNKKYFSKGFGEFLETF
jgi:hypothetical protein